jgi:hypothetical protein
MPRIRLSSAVPIAVAALATIALGCGGGSGATAALTKAEFIARADAICEKADERQAAALLAFEKKHPKSGSSKSWQEKIVLAAALPPVRSEAEELASLPAPSGDEERVKAIVVGMDEAAGEAGSEPSALLNEASAGPFTAVVKLAREYGFKGSKSCSNPL